MKPYLAKLYSGATRFRNFLYESGFADSIRVPEPVISVGNITVGGTGKTPLVDLILSHYESRGVKTGLISRSYKAQCQSTEIVNLRHPSGAQYYGDEAWMLAERHPDTLVCVGPWKWLALWQASQKKQAQIFVVDDGFQHRALHRDLDIVLLDTTADFDEYELLPKGRGRESWDSLARADVVILIKTNLATSDQVHLLRSRIASDQVVVEAGLRVDLTPFAGRKAFAFAGLAKSNQFEQTLRDSGQVELTDFRSFPDHHRYLQEDIQRIEKLAEGSEVILTTEKDFVKLSHLSLSLPLFPVRMEVPLFSGAEEFYARLDSVLR